MPVCNTCGNDYPKAFEIVMDGKRYWFDCFECAIHLLAPTCHTCGCGIIGHGVEHENVWYCCQHCVKSSGGLNVPHLSV